MAGSSRNNDTQSDMSERAADVLLLLLSPLLSWISNKIENYYTLA